ncbi:lipopolysaccharide export system permease protein [Allochromatium warmingii]|uniref:Lipopolysaccharide export system permease protein LptF n=1 Tax=Allochromatium warmingii TaxID=61595 RepID=A0A1H3JD62_ALLWA|nr:LPS export ABC transporter permease LptF [Allochromatium warmingii]SDY37970.1 lipopolysaccharide export system permease protein [Allochromatium warmingii]
MIGRLDRYLLSEVTKAFLVIVLVLVLIMASLMFLRTLEEVNLGGLGSDVVFRYLGLQIQRNLSSLLPPAFFLAMLMTLSRLSRDSELIAMQACGVGPPHLYRTLLLLALPVALVTGWVALVLKPQAAAGIYEIRLQQQQQAAQIAGLQAGRFYVAGQIVVYIGAIDRRKALGDVFVLDQRSGKTRLVVSTAGRHRLEDASGDHLVTLFDGHRFDGQAGAGAYLIGQFDQYQLRIAGTGPTQQALSKRAAIATPLLWRSQTLIDRVELQQRLAAPVSILTLALLAIPLIDPSPRQKTSGRILLALLAYFSFFNLQRLAERWMEAGVTPDWLGSLWYQVAILACVHLLLLPDRVGWRWLWRRG